jgi:AraC family transcriptional regulator of adaptative response / DNA-3-methyladenine glycosylase II
MDLDPSACYRALRARDARFDGRFFVGVRSTGIYCRPVCPAPTPKRENCLFLPCAAAAQEAGFRPCLRCRPESSPGTPAWLGTSATVSRALRLIGEGALDRGHVEDLAARLGVGERHLRRLFWKHLGASPQSVSRTRRILFAKKLINETSLPLGEVALASGFQSIRRFNAAIRKAYRRTPRELRCIGGAAGLDIHGSELTLRLPFRPPFAWSALVRFLAPRATPGVEEVGPVHYRRTLRLGDVEGAVEVSPVEEAAHLLARIRLSRPEALIQVAGRLRRLFDLEADPATIDAHLALDPRLADRVRHHPGLRVPGAWDGFELAVRAILGQQVSVKAATHLAGRLVAIHGEPLGSGVMPFDGLSRLFPEPPVLARADLTRLGLTRARARAISCLAAAVAEGRLELDASRPLEAALAGLMELPGVGEWTAHYVAMRALGQPDAFPASDLGLRRAAANGQGCVPIERFSKCAEAWRPWRAYAAMHLWLSAAEQA